MLVYFKVGNYKSIKDPVTLTFIASSISEHVESNLLQTERESILKSLLLYGHNASGKSKILDAFAFFKRFITHSAIQNQGNEPIDVTPFLLNQETEDKPSFFEAGFLLGNLKYRYGFEVDKIRVHKEWLLYSKAEKEYPIFLRIHDQFDIHVDRFENAEGLDKRTRENALFLSVASQWNVPKAEAINKWFASIYTLSGLKDNRIFKDLTIQLLLHSTYKSLIQEFIKKADLGIQSIEFSDAEVQISEQFPGDSVEVKRTIYRTLSEMDGKSIITKHYKYDIENKIIGSTSFLLDKDESEGTKKYFSLIGLILKSIFENRLIVIDEFDARLHTLLSKAITKLFNSSKIKSNAQLLVASHDTALLDNRILRRDQIYFVEKDAFGASNVTSLVEYKPRKESPFDKNYLEGKYGAIPFIDDLETLVANGQKTI